MHYGIILRQAAGKMKMKQQQTSYQDCETKGEEEENNDDILLLK